MVYLVLFLLGLSAGSFLSVVVYRLRAGEAVWACRSHCDFCRKKISWYDNIPLLSYCLLKGKCRYCRRKIPPEYPLTELVIGLEFVWIYWLLTVNYKFWGTWEGGYSLALLIYWLVLFSGSLAIAIYDFKYLLIPDLLLWPLIVLTGLRLLVTGQWQYLTVAAAAAGFLALLWLITKKRGLGTGDIELGLLMGLVLGYPKIIAAFFLAFLTGALAGVILILVKKKQLRDRIAFGPFLIAAMLAAKLCGDLIWQWYQRVLL